MREQISLRRIESLRPMNVLLAVGEVLLHRHSAVPLLIGGPHRCQRSSQSESGGELPFQALAGDCEWCWSCCHSLADQPGNHGIEGNGALAVFAGTLKVDPAFVKAIDHADAWQGVLHALRAEKLFPGLARNGLSADLAAERGGKGTSYVGGRVTTRSFELDDPNAVPVFLK